MDNPNPSFLRQIISLWSRIGAGQQTVLVAFALIIFVGFAIWLSMARQPTYALLYGDLDPTDAGRIISELQGENIKYKLTEGGKNILVPADKVDELRISLASGGFTPSKTSGYEILDKSQLGMSESTQSIQRTRALEGEISKTLMSLDEISAARVHLTLPDPTPFITEQESPSASVVLEVRPIGTVLDRSRVAAVQTFVAGAIGAKNLDSITIIDQNMNLLTGPSRNQPGALLPSQDEARRNYETQRAADIRALLERAYGIGKVAVSFSCVMDFDQVQTESTTVNPVAGTEHGVLISEESTETSTKGSTSSGGVPGTDSNIPSYPNTSGKPTESKSSTETKNYEASQTREVRTQAPGTLKSTSVSVIIDSTDREITATDKTDAEKLIASAAGINQTQGDSITVAFKPFDTSIRDDLASEKTRLASASSKNLWLNVGMILGAFLIFWIVLRNFLKPVVRPFAMASASTSQFDEEAPALINVELPSADPEVLEKLRVREEIERLIKEDPAAAAKVIKSWLQE